MRRGAHVDGYALRVCQANAPVLLPCTASAEGVGLEWDEGSSRGGCLMNRGRCCCWVHADG